MRIPTSRDHARDLDLADGLPLRRAQFAVPLYDSATAESMAYLCGHSLGLMPSAARDAILQSVADWADRGVDGHFAPTRGWYRADDRPVATVASLLGAHEDEVAVANALTVNLHLLLVSFFRPAGARRKILIEAGAFPSDRYAVTSQLRWHGLDPRADLLEVAPDQAGLVTTDAIASGIETAGSELALVLVSGVNFRTGEALDIGRLGQVAHDQGAMFGVDLAHAAGNIELSLHNDQVDFAAWCNYKYLNSGPGAVGGLFVHRRHGADSTLPRFAGWWGNDPDSRFSMDDTPDFVARTGAAGWKISNPPIVSLAAVEASLGVFAAHTMTELRRRSVTLTATLEALLDTVEGVQQITPREPHRRGAMLTLRVEHAPHDLVARLARRGVIVDLRPPDLLRVAPVPLYNGYEDIWRFVEALVIEQRDAR